MYPGILKIIILAVLKKFIHDISNGIWLSRVFHDYESKPFCVYICSCWTFSLPTARSGDTCSYSFLFCSSTSTLPSSSKGTIILDNIILQFTYLFACRRVGRYPQISWFASPFQNYTKTKKSCITFIIIFLPKNIPVTFILLVGS